MKMKCERKTSLMVLIAYMLVMGLWMLNASAVAGFDGWGKDRMTYQFIPMMQGIGFHGETATCYARCLQAFDAAFELVIGVMLLLGAFWSRRRLQLLGLSTALLVALMGGFLVCSFTYSGAHKQLDDAEIIEMIGFSCDEKNCKEKSCEKDIKDENTKEAKSCEKKKIETFKDNLKSVSAWYPKYPTLIAIFIGIHVAFAGLIGIDR